MQKRRLTLALLTLATLAAGIAAAADIRVVGTSLRIDDSRSLRRGIAKLKRSLVLQMEDASIVLPAEGSAADPSLHGATIFLVHAPGAGESARVDLPAGGWVREPTAPSSPLVAWRYQLKGSTKVRAELRDGSLSLRARDVEGTLLGYTLDESSQGAIAAVVELGVDRLCAEFGGRVRTDAGGSDAGCNTRGRFRAEAAPAPVACADTSSAPSSRDVCDVFELLDLLVEGQMESASIAGVGAALVSQGEVVWSKGYGLRSVSPSRPALADTPFMLASVSKTVTATAVMQLVEDGVLGLDDDIDGILEFSVDNPRVPGDEVITVRHLLTHTSGLADDETVWGGYPGEPGSLYTLGDSPIELGTFLEGYYVPGGAWYDANRNFTPNPPGASYLYSNVATALLGHLVESATGTPLDDWCDANIFAPLAMTNTGWHLADFSTSAVAMPYESFGGNFYEYGQYGYPDYPNGQLRSSAADLARYLAAYINGGALDAVRILEQSSVDAMLTVQFPAVDPGQGLSWYRETIAGHDVIGHGGSDYGAYTDMFFDPASGDGVIVLVNVDGTPAVEKALARIEGALFGLGESMRP
ncbi:MAG: serine hydrolase domain-containing protein [Candidatus Binatia bacterium]